MQRQNIVISLLRIRGKSGKQQKEDFCLIIQSRLDGCR